MQEQRAFTIDQSVLATDSSPSDRFVAQPSYATFDPWGESDIIQLPAHQVDLLARWASLKKDGGLQTRDLTNYKGATKAADAMRAWIEKAEQAQAAPQQSAASRKAIKRSTDELKSLTEEYIAAADAGDGEAIAELSGLMRNRTESLAAVLVQEGSGSTTTAPPPPPPATASIPPETQVEAMLAVELGLLFLDRTRIRPVGFALGEHIQSFSLAPGEEVTLEQRTYSKRETSFEEASEQEQTLDTEMSSTFTTELAEGMSTEHTRTSADQNSLGMNIGGSIYGINFNVGPQTSSNVTDANKTSSNGSAKKAQTASSKVAAKNRSQHKTVLKVSTESRFESTAKRTFRNPNPRTPIDLQYFKVLQRLELAHERTGVRLCWSPAVNDPAAKLFARLIKVRDKLFADASAATSGPMPKAPDPPAADTRTPQVITASQICDKFDWLWGNQRFDYPSLLTAPTGYEWDGDRNFIRNSLSFTFTGTRPAGASVDAILPSGAIPMSGSMVQVASGTSVTVIVHVGIEDCRNPFKPNFFEPVGSASYTVSARFIPSVTSGSDPAYNKALADWRTAQTQWEAAEREVKAAATIEAERKWREYLETKLKQISPIHETLGAMMTQMFPSDSRDSPWEVDFWENVFDWKNAALRLYPSWWSDAELRDPFGGPYDYLNASWARLYLPIKPGAEAQALRWIYERKIAGQRGSSGLEKMISLVEKDLKNYRVASFGSAEEISITDPQTGCPEITEQVLCLGKWHEVLPTDGTHIEVMQSTSTAADDEQVLAADVAGELNDKRIERATIENEIRTKARTDGLGEIETGINLDLGSDSSQ